MCRPAKAGVEVAERGEEGDAPEGVGCAAVGRDFTQTGRGIDTLLSARLGLHRQKIGLESEM